MSKVIFAIYEILNLTKGFVAGYSTETCNDGKMIIEHEGVRYFLKVEKVECPEEKISKDINKLKYWS